MINFLLYILAIIIAVLLAFAVAIAIVLIPGWPEWYGFAGKSVWDVAQPLMYAFVFSATAYALTQLNQRQTRETSEARVEAERNIAQSVLDTLEARQKTEQEAANTRQVMDIQAAQESLVQGYFDEITTLILDRGLRTADPDSDVRRMAQSRTMGILDSVDDYVKGNILKYLHEANLLTEPEPILSLAKADFQEADLIEAKLPNLFLRDINLQSADLTRAVLRKSDLRKANLREATLKNTNFIQSDLSQANLSNANLSGAKLGWTQMNSTILIGADLSGADLNSAKLRFAKLNKANLQGARLTGVDLHGARLEGATYDDDTKWPSDFDPEGE